MAEETNAHRFNKKNKVEYAKKFCSGIRYSARSEPIIVQRPIKIKWSEFEKQVKQSLEIARPLNLREGVIVEPENNQVASSSNPISIAGRHLPS